jgi:PIN domain nuclease of toxin-antitoxin system
VPALHRDLFDRIIISQAPYEGVTLVASDPMMRAYPVRVIQAH